MTETPAVELRQVTKRFRDVVAVQDLSLVIEQGEFFSLLGPSGCGKTTTLRLLAGFEMPTEGVITLRGADVSHLPPFRRNVNTVFQSYALFPHLTVARNVAFGLEMKGVGQNEIDRRVGEALALVQLPNVHERLPKQLSGGQQQRVALARALINRPEVLLLDEPLGALDFKLRKAMQLELKALQRQLGITFIFVTHDQEEALVMSDRIGVMNHGRLLQVGTPQAIYEHPTSRFVAGFIGDTNFIDGRVTAYEAPVATVRVAEGLAFAGQTTEAVQVGQTVMVAIRPEKMRVVPPDEARVKGVIRECIFMGTDTQLLVELEAGVRLEVLHQNMTTATMRSGQVVGLTWQDESVSMLTE